MLSLIYFVSPNQDIFNGFSPWEIWTVISLLLCFFLSILLGIIFEKRIGTCLGTGLIFFILMFCSISGFYGLNASGWLSGLLMFCLLPFLLVIGVICCYTLMIGLYTFSFKKKDYRSLILIAVGIGTIVIASWIVSLTLEKVFS